MTGTGTGSAAPPRRPGAGGRTPAGRHGAGHRTPRRPWSRPPAPPPAGGAGGGLVPVLLAAAAAAASLAARPLFTGGATVADAVAAASVASALAALAARATTRRRRATGGLAALGAGAAGAVLCSVWLTVPGSTVAGIPTSASAAALGRGIASALAAVGHAQPPIPATPGLRLAYAVAAGVLAATAQALWAGTRRPLLALLPLGVVLVVASGLTPRRDLLAAVTWTATAALVVLAAGRAPRRAVRRRTGTGSPLAAGGLALLAVAAGAVAGAAPLAGTRLTVHRHSMTVPQTLVVRQPTADLAAVKVRLAQTKVFTVTSPVASYWQLTSLTSFDGTSWTVGPPGTRAGPPEPAGRTPGRAGSSGSSSGRAGTGSAGSSSSAGDRSAGGSGSGSSRAGATADRHVLHVVQDVHVQGLDSPWLPAAPVPTAVTVTGIGTAHLDPASGAIVSDVAPVGYRVVSAVTGMDPAQLAALGPPRPAAWLHPYLALPRQPAPVTQLAHRVVAGASGPYRKALDLVAFLTSSRFHYTLSPPAYPRHADPLVAFLTVTRAGYCQQFASAFAVLARLDGLPTRLAVGFTAGQPIGHHTYQVTGSDAHVWPEVYLGPSAGWVSFEPTPPATTASAPTAGGTAALPAQATTGSSATTPVGVQGLAHRPRPGGSAGRSAGRAAAAPAPHGAPAQRGVPVPAVLAGASAAVALAALLALAAAVRSRRWRPRRLRLDPAARIDQTWASTTARLRRRRLGPRADETPREYAQRLHATAADHAGRPGDTALGDLAGAVTELAHLVDAARHAPVPPAAAAADHARSLAARARRASRAAPRPRRSGGPTGASPDRREEPVGAGHGR